MARPERALASFQEAGTDQNATRIWILGFLVVPFYQLFFGGGLDNRKKGTVILTSLLEDRRFSSMVCFFCFRGSHFWVPLFDPPPEMCVKNRPLVEIQKIMAFPSGRKALLWQALKWVEMNPR